jgi:acid stress chaperone HdeB
MRTLFIALFATVLASTAPAKAQVVDLNTITCKDFFEGPGERISYVLFWLDAYYRDEDDPAVIDFNKVKENAAKLGEHCAKNPTLGLITAADALFDK